MTYVFPGGRAMKLITNSVNFINSSNLLVLTKNITLLVVYCCAPPPIKLAAYCIGSAATIGASILSPNPVTIGSAIYLVTELYEEC